MNKLSSLPKRHFAVASVALMSALMLGACSKEASETQKLRIGVEGAYPPFSQVGTDGKLQGFDIDIANAVCAEMKADCLMVQQEFDGMIPGLNARKLDAVVASMSITDERKKSVDFSDKYYQTPARYVTKADATAPVSVDGLKGKRIGVQRTTIHDRFATATFTQSEIVRYTKQDDVFLDLTAGRLDGALVDLIAADQGFLKLPTGKGFAFQGPTYTDPAFFGVGAGIAVRKGDTALLNRINAALKAIRGNGTYKKIQDKYFDFDVYGETAPTAPQAAVPAKS
jgi:arginine/ornithine transport system substrate-binding protein